MINVKSEVYSAISDMSSNVGDTYPKDWAVFPAIQYTEEENKVQLWTDGEEQSAYIRYRFDIWHSVSTSAYATELDRRISALGLKRSQCMDVDDPSGLKHKVMRYEAIIDVTTEFLNHI